MKKRDAGVSEHVGKGGKELEKLSVALESLPGLLAEYHRHSALSTISNILRAIRSMTETVTLFPNCL